jgi:hypothetical protein
MKTQKNEEVNFFTGSPDDIHNVLEQKKTQRLYLELLSNGKLIEAKELWDKVIRYTFVVKELQVCF